MGESAASGNCEACGKGGARAIHKLWRCHPERARPMLARESKDPYSEDVLQLGVLRLVRAKAARTRSA